MRTVTFKLEENLLELLDRYAMKYGLNRSEVIRKAIEMLVRAEFEKGTVVEKVNARVILSNLRKR